MAFLDQAVSFPLTSHEYPTSLTTTDCRGNRLESGAQMDVVSVGII